jgi:hypothetical protein
MTMRLTFGRFWDAARMRLCGSERSVPSIDEVRRLERTIVAACCCIAFDDASHRRRRRAPVP